MQSTPRGNRVPRSSPSRGPFLLRAGGLTGLIVLAALAAYPSAAAELTLSRALQKPLEWYRSDEGRRLANHVLSWQTRESTWPKNTDTLSRPFRGDRGKLRGTFDNHASLRELRFLARAVTATGDARFQQAFLEGYDVILKAQYPSGGWPQSYPPGKGYARHITFNDGTLVGIMSFLREVAIDEGYDFVDPARRQSARRAFDRGLECIVRCQIMVNGQRTVWCAQHDAKTLEPRPARSYELPSLSGGESAGTLRFLMSVNEPSPEVIRAVRAGVAWFKSAQLNGIRQVVVDGNKRIVTDATAPPLWARFYEIESNRPFFCGRDGVKKYSIAEIEAERRNGYAWYGNWGQSVLEAYARWDPPQHAPQGERGSP